jgi:hypothetical protein
MNSALLYSFEDLCDWLHQATLETFQASFGLRAFLVPAPPFNTPNERLAASRISFSGAREATLTLAVTPANAAFLASRMLEISEAEVRPENIEDVMKELGNMILGGVKSRISDLGEDCSMGIPQSAEWTATDAEEFPGGEEDQWQQRMKFGFDAGELLVDFVFLVPTPQKRSGT